MKLIINRQGYVVAVHNDDQDIKNLYTGENLEFIRVPNDAIIQTPIPQKTNQNSPDDFALGFEDFDIDMPKDPRISWDLATLKTNAKKVIPDIENEYRDKIISSSASKIASYKSKEQVARRILASEVPEGADVILLKTEADNRGLNVTELANIILGKVNKFNEVSSFIDGEAHKIIKIIDDHQSYQNISDSSGASLGEGEKIVDNNQDYQVIWKALADLEQSILTKIN
ncbi:MAG: hypothetical protein ACI9TO_000247 [Rickettsiales bacterium]|jgi:hypothetical protein